MNSKDNVQIQSNRKMKCCSTKNEKERPTSIKKEQAINSLYPDAAADDDELKLKFFSQYNYKN